ncbi:MAG: hypothetical protein EWM72_01691 [Nitrospira sp.]|nr:MAG: hypothetical protein EWM72_01691 [Nitrospira sp.]
MGSGSNKFCLAVLAGGEGASWRAQGGRVKLARAVNDAPDASVRMSVGEEGNKT